jgi:hypothetical protein
MPIAEERWAGANGLRASDTFVLAFHYRRPSTKTEGGQSVAIADGWKDTESDDNHNVRSCLHSSAFVRPRLTTRADVAQHGGSGRPGTG